MEARWIVARQLLRTLKHNQPDWSIADYAAATGKSKMWVSKWLKRFAAAPPDDETVLHSRSRARHQPPPKLAQVVVDRLLSLRAMLPGTIHRIPGPLTLIYYLNQDATLQGQRLPRSTSTVWAILKAAGLLPPPPKREPQPLPRPAPWTSWQLDFKDATTVAPDGGPKRQHRVEILNMVDSGTSILVGSLVHADYRTETLLDTLEQFLAKRGLPNHITFDRDSRFVGGGGHRDVPAAFLRFWLCLGVRLTICPPHRPDRNGFVERYHRTLEEECLRVKRPQTCAEVKEVTEAFLQFYNEERPHQGLSCRNQPPRVAFPDEPTLRPLPREIDPDAWVTRLDGQYYVRRVQRDASIKIDGFAYYVRQTLVGQDVLIQINAAERAFVITHGNAEIKRVPMKGLWGSGLVPFEQWLKRLCAEARTERLAHAQGLRQLALPL